MDLNSILSPEYGIRTVQQRVGEVSTSDGVLVGVVGNGDIGAVQLIEYFDRFLRKRVSLSKESSRPAILKSRLAGKQENNND
jgi:hypothetical protein